MPKRRLVYSGAIVLTILLVILLTGATYQFVEAKEDLAKNPAPGRLVDIGGYRLHLNCLGAGSPTVLLESGIADDSLTWAGVQPAIAKATRVCSYDRAGYGWSDPSPRPRDANTIALELHTLLVNAGVSGPFVLVGHSLGGMIVREYAGLYRSDVVGMVLVDSTSPNQYKRMDASISRGNEKFLRKLGYLEDTMPFGWLRLSGWCDRWPAAERDVRRTTECRMQPWRTHMAEWRAFDEDSAEVLAAGPVGDIPLTVVTEGTPTTNDLPNSFGAIQKELIQLSPEGRQIFVAGGHMVQVDHPQAVVDAILGVLADTRRQGAVTRTSLP